MFTRAALLCLALSACSSNRDESCVLEPGPSKGSMRFRCPNGESILLNEPISPVPSGSLAGEVHRFGLDDASGVEVLVQETGFITHTDAAGLWSIKDIDPGPYQLNVSFPAYQTWTSGRKLVLPGVAQVPPVVLHVSRPILPSRVEQLILSPRRDAVLAPSKGALDLWVAPLFEAASIASDAVGARFTADGEYVYVSERGSPGTLTRWRVSTLLPEIIDAGVDKWELTDDDRSVAYSRFDENRNESELHVWDGNDRHDTEVARGLVNGADGAAWTLEKGNLLLARIKGDTAPVLVGWNIRQAKGLSLARTQTQIWEVAPGGDSLVFQTNASDLVLSTSRGPRRLGNLQPVCGPPPPGTGCNAFSPDGRRLLLKEDDSGWLYVTDVVHFSPVPIAQNTAVHHFSADGTRVLVLGNGARDLGVFDLASAKMIPIEQGPSAYEPAFSPRGDAVTYNFASVALAETRLWTKDLGSIQAAPETGTVLWAPKGDALVVGGAYPSTDPPVNGSAWWTEVDGTRKAQLLAKEVGPVAADFVRFSPDGSRIAFVDLYPGSSTVGVLKVLDRATGAVDEIASDVSAGFQFTPAGDIIFIQRFVQTALWGRLAILRDGEIIELAERAAWDAKRRIVVSEEGKRVLFHVLQPDGPPRLTFMDLDVRTPIPVEDSYSPFNPLITESFFAYFLGTGDRPGVYASLYPEETPQGGVQESSP